MLHLNTQESLETLTYSIQRNQRRLPHQIAQSHLNGDIQTSKYTQQQILMAQQRKEWFKPHLALIAEVEGFLIQFPNRVFYQQQWHQAIDQIGDLTVPQSVIQTFALRCDLLALGWFFIENTFIHMKSLLEKGFQSPVLEHCFLTFQQSWEQLWQAFFDFHHPQADEIIKNALQQFSQISQQLMEV